MAPSLSHRTTGSLALRWRHSMAAVATAAVAVGLLAVPAYAEEDQPVSQQGATSTPDAEPTDAQPTEAADEATADAMPSDGPSGGEASSTAPHEEPEPRGEGRADSAVGQQAAPLQCDSVYALQGAGMRNVWSVDTATGGLTSVGNFAIAGNDGENLNGLGVSADGQKVYGVIPDASGTGRTIYLHDRASGATTALGAGVASAVTTIGAVNPINGFYYYGGLTSGVLNIYGFDTTTGTSIGRVASGSIPNGGGGNGDWAFDGQGRLYVVAGAANDNRISVINQAIPTTPQATPLAITGTQIARSTVNAAINGIAFGGDSYLYIASSSRIYKINPSSGVSVSDVALSPTNSSVDLASCAVPSTIEVIKDFPEGRSVSSHQATLSVSGGGLTAAVTATTTGTDDGLQDDPAETAGPVLGLNGNTYTVSESGTGASSVLYDSSWECENTATRAVLASGTGTSGAVTLPAGAAAVPVLCTFTNIHKFADFGDAPTSYETTSAQGGPVHKLPGYNSNTNTAALTLGTNVDAENDGAPGPNADGDDSAGVDDEDGVFFNTDVSVPGRLETVFVRVSAPGFLNGWIDFNSDGDFDSSEQIFTDTPVTNVATTSSQLNRLTYTVPNGSAFVPGDTHARFRLTKAAGQATAPTGPAPNGEVEDYTRVLYDAEEVALAQCPRDSTPIPVGIIRNPSFETRTGDFVNSGSARTIHNAEDWWDSHPTGGQYFLFRPDFDSGPPDTSAWPWRAGADGYGFLGGHTAAVSGNNDVGEGAVNTLENPLVPGATYVGFFSIGAFTNQRTNPGYMRFFGVNDKDVGSIAPATGVVPHSLTNSETLFDTEVVSRAVPPLRPQWKLQTFTLKPSKPWPYLRVEARNADPAGNASVATQAWINFDDFHMYLCEPIRDFSDAPATFGTDLAGNGPYHDIPNYDRNMHTAPLMLGSTIDLEQDGAPSATADGDDSAGTDDEDGLTSVTMKAGATTASATVAVTNSTGAGATLYAWADADADGAFQASEATTVTVPNGATTATLSWSGLAPLPKSDTVVRLRLTSGTLSDNVGTATLDERGLGAAPDGEVEDHAVTVEWPTVTCTSDPAMFNTAYNGNGGKLAPGARDLNWEVGLGGNATGPGSATNWIPAHVVNIPSAWYAGEFGSSAWIAQNLTGGHNNPADVYFRYRFRIASSVTLDGFTLPMSFFADNSVPEVWVNGVAQSPFQATLPQAKPPANPYFYQGYIKQNAAGTELTEGFQHGDNEIVVRVASAGPNLGFMAEVDPEPLCNDRGDAPDSYGTAGSGGASHGLTDFVGANQTKLMLGDTVDADGDAQPSAAADGDDTTSIDDEDALDPLILTPGATTATSTVRVTNVTGLTARLIGWIDANGDGSFQPGEAAVADVPGGAPTATLSWTGLPAISAGRSTVVRLRLTTVTLVDNAGTAARDERSVGSAPDGEVEDHLASILPPNDFGDSPDSYGTLAGTNGAVHNAVGPRLGAQRDTEDDGAPGAAADGDDAAGVDDEDGVAFNPALGYPNPTIRTGPDPITLDPVVNHVTVNASAPGFASVWVDWDLDGDFTDPGERVAEAQPVTAGDNDITFSQGANPADIRTYVRVRYSTDASAIHAPTGPAPDGEVEDYQVLVERLISPAACSPVTEPYYAMTFNTVTDKTGAGAPGTSARYPSVTVVEGEVVDAIATTGSPGNSINANGFFVGGVDDAAWNLNSGGAAVVVEFTFVRRGTTTPVPVNTVWTVNDMDSGERTDYVPDTQAADYAITPGSLVSVTRAGGRLIFSGTASGNNDVRSRYQVWFNDLSAVSAIWRGFGNSGFSIDGDGDSPVPKSCDDYGDAPDSYKTRLDSDGPHHTVTPELRLGADSEFDGDGQPTAAADGDDTNRNDDEDGVGPISVTSGRAPTVDVDVTNLTAGPATVVGWVDLDKSGTFDANERAITSVPAGTNGDTVTLTFAGAVTTTQATYARFRLFPGTVANPLPTGAATAGEVEDHRVTTLTPALTVTKTSDATADSGPGDTVAYTVTLTNTGTGAFDAANPARVVDDLTGVLDDATYQGDAAATVDGAAVTDPTYTEPRIAWSGPLEAGKTVMLTYSVVLKGGGDGHVRNIAFVPPPGNPNPPTPDCAQTTQPCVTTRFELPKLSISKTSNRTQLPAVGQQITYTVTVENTGLGDYTADHPATFADDLSDVLDDATLTQADVSATRGTATFTSPELSWSGTLPAGETATVTYTLTYTGAGDQQLDNSACIPVAEAADPADACRTVSVPGSGLRHDKSVDPASGTPVQVGQVLTYTLTFENVGSADATVDTADDLSGVLDDAQLVGVPTADAGLSATVNGTQLEIDGTVPGGQTRTVTYQVQVRAFAAQGDHRLTNVLACEPSEPAGCAPKTTSNPVRHLTLTKTSDATADSRPGDEVTYTVTAHNDGEGDWTALDPATVVDDLSGLLDDAQFDGTVTASAGTTSYVQPRLRWTGPIAHGETVTISYTVSLTGGGDGQVDNVVWRPTSPGNPGPTPDCVATAVPCADHGYDLPKLTIKKVSNRAQLPAAGNKITYTVTVTNPGPGDYTAAAPATFTDDLSDVLDDATFDAGSMTASTGTATLSGDTLDWSGVLAAGESATVTYTLTYQETGNLVVDNKACISAEEALDPDETCRTVHTPGSGLRQTKKVDPRTGTSVVEGQVLTYTLTFENVGPAAATVDTVDDLSGVVDDADLVAGSVTAGAGLTATPNAGGDALAITGSVPTGETRTVTYQVRVKDFADQGDHVATNALACQPGDPQPCDPTVTSNPVRHVVVSKGSDATADSKPGDTVTYTVRVRNDGAGDYNAANPAAMVDDLTGVLDDATFNGTANASQGPAPTYDEPRIAWSGPLAAGDEVRITYEVVLTGGGDGVVRNVAWAPTHPGDPGPTPDCATAIVPCASESFDLPKLTVQKSADRADLPAVGQTVTYTVLVTNVGPGVYTADHPATLTDDLSDVLDDGTVGTPTATGGDAIIIGDTLTWTGVLGAVGDAAEITYTVTYRARGDRVLDNTACVPAGEAQDPAAACDTVSVPGSGLVHRKSVNPVSGTAVEVGDTLTYTLTFDNTAGQAAASVDTTDDLSQVLDDATFDDASITEGAGLDATRVGNTLTVIGTVPAGATRTVTYQVTVKPFADQGDHVLTNALACEPGEATPCAPATTSNPVRHLVLTKEKTSPSSPDTGDQVTYTLTVRNDGTGDWTDADPASVVDDLSEVLDDATWDDTAAATDGTVGFTSPELTWSGDLAQGATVTITYSVTVTNQGDHELTNTASVTGCRLDECSPDPVVVPLPHVVPSKTAAPAAGATVQPGDEVTYTLSWTNDGTAAGVVDSTDDLSGVLDDAEVVQEPTSSSAAVTATRTGNALRVVGPIPADDTVTVTYRVRVKPFGSHGDNRLANVLTQDTPQVDCAPLPCIPVPPPATEHPVGDLEDWKTVTPSSGTIVQASDRLTYTLHFASTGTGPVVVDRVDDLRGVLDDATLVSGPTASVAGLTVAAPVGGLMSVTGTLPPGVTGTVTYTVQVKKDGRRGDDRLGNFLLDPGQSPPPSCNLGTSPKAADKSDCTANGVKTTDFNLRLDKRVVSGAKVQVGDLVRYKLQVSNKGPGEAPLPIVLRDPLPQGLELVSANGKGWTCKVDKAKDKAICKRTKPLKAGRKAPPVTLVARATAAAKGKAVNKAKVGAAGDTKPSDNRDVAAVTVTAPPPLPGTGFRLGAVRLGGLAW